MDSLTFFLFISHFYNNIQIPDDDAGLPLEYFVIPFHYQESVSSVLISHGLILDRVEKVICDFEFFFFFFFEAIFLISFVFSFYSITMTACKRYR